MLHPIHGIRQINTYSTQNTICGRLGCLSVKEAESLELERISESSHYAGSGQDFFAPSLFLREIRFPRFGGEEQLFGGLVSAPMVHQPLVGPLWRQ